MVKSRLLHTLFVRLSCAVDALPIRVFDFCVEVYVVSQFVSL